MSIKKYWLVHNAAQQNSGQAFQSLPDAQAAAQRLSRCHMSNPIAVFEMVDCYQATMPESERVDIEL
jgi:hypothetical protein